MKHIIVGRADNSGIAPSEPASKAKVPVDSSMRGMTGMRLLETLEKANAQLDNLVKILENHIFNNTNRKSCNGIRRS